MALYAISALTSAFLLFWVEPLFARMVLPLLGGSPAVWNTCLMAYQGLLLLGYAYVHAGARFLTVRRQAALHVLFASAAALVLPVAIPGRFIPADSGSVVMSLATGTIVALGAPFVVLAATAPMLQRWLASFDHPAAANPYVLYAASNAGSLLGLLAFPIVLEPAFGLSRQTRFWTLGYGVVLVLLAACAITVTRQRDAPAAGIPTAPYAGRRAEAGESPTWISRLRWTLLAFVPSSLLLGVTTYLSTDVAAAPLLWVIPLALYLLTFIIVFARRGPAAVKPVALLQAAGATALVILMFWRTDVPLLWAYPIHLTVFTLTALALHGELAASRPAPRFLTEYYLWMAFGGALGGVFNTLVAPVVFESIAEYQLMLVTACLLRPSMRRLPAGRLDRAQALAAALTPALTLAVVAVYGLGDQAIAGVQWRWFITVAVGLLLVSQWRNTIRFGVGVAGVSVAGLLVFKPWHDFALADRTFFGTYRVQQLDNLSLLYHGTTIHGAQFQDPDRRRTPLTYYHPDGPVGGVFRQLGATFNSVGVVGLGAGSLLCYAEPGQQWTFYEIDPAVEQIARDDRYFTFLRDCPTRASVVLGDARLTLAREPSGRFDLLVLDAFSSDAVPVHLLTREAVALYRRLLSERGLLLVHISNRHLELEPVIAALAEDSGLTGRIAEHDADEKAEALNVEYSCDWVLLSPRSDRVGSFASDSAWRPLHSRSSFRVWTDDYSNVFGVIKH